MICSVKFKRLLDEVWQISKAACFRGKIQNDRVHSENLYPLITLTAVLYKDFQPWEKPEQHRWKNAIFFNRMLDIANQLLTRHLPFALLCHVNDWQSLHQSQSKFSRIIDAKKLESSFHSQTIFFRRNQNIKEKTEGCVLSRLRIKIDSWRIYHRPILAVHLKRFFLLVRKRSVIGNL